MKDEPLKGKHYFMIDFTIDEMREARRNNTLQYIKMKKIYDSWRDGQRKQDVKQLKRVQYKRWKHKNPEKARKWIEELKRREKIYKEKGLCIGCGKPTVTKLHCEYHRQKNNKAAAKSVKKRKGGR